MVSTNFTIRPLKYAANGATLYRANSLLYARSRRDEMRSPRMS